MSLIPALVQEVLKIFFGGLFSSPPGGIGLKLVRALHNVAFISRLTANTLQCSYTISDIDILDINI